MPEHKGYGEDLTSGLEKLRKKAEVSLVQPNTREILQAIRKAASAVSGGKVRGELKRGIPKLDTGVSSSSNVHGKRKHNSLASFTVNSSKRKVNGVLAPPGDLISAQPTSPDGSDLVGSNL